MLKLFLIGFGELFIATLAVQVIQKQRMILAGVLCRKNHRFSRKWPHPSLRARMYGRNHGQDQGDEAEVGDLQENPLICPERRNERVRH